ncbi:MAG: WGR domain-containing protein [Deltaproteobacteria bacterium]|nr:WGR domain-containing protein [Deltaproteobacteria bacterium]
MADWNVYLEFTEGSSSKFWRGRVDGGDLHTNWGRIGTDGQTKTASYGTEDAALAELEKQASKKRKKGYADASGGAAAPADAPEPPPEPESYEASLKLKEAGRSITLSLSVDGSSLKTAVEETYESEDAARAAFARIKRQLVEDGYQG